MSVLRSVKAVNWTGLGVIVLVLVLWQVAVDTGILSLRNLPSPIAVAQSFGKLTGVGEAVGHTLLVALVAFVSALVIGAAVGLILGLSGFVRTFANGSLDFLRTLPVVALMPVALLVWGPSTKTEIIVATYASLWPVAVNVSSGVARIHPQLREMARSLKLSKWENLTKIVVPAAVPSLLVGARLALTSALVIAIVAEMLVNPSGLGWALSRAQSGMQPGQMWAYVAIIAVIGLVLNAIVVFTVERLVPGGRPLPKGRG
ncbi:sulfonate transport system permease protein [Rhodococcus sp. 27YEA15]|uniref:ABC transporter permease n=1 Tax=Rhodococcus sp. 27YEA15 TaxID=3156259 RepID=UPI003C7C734D